MKIFNILPHVIAISPGQTQDKEFQRDLYIQMDEQEFLSPDIQRPYQYLRRLSQGSLPVTFSYDHPEGDPVNCVKVLLDASGSSSMSWQQLKCFASFLNIQLKNCELSDFLNLRLTGPEFYHLKEFVVRFMIRMAQDFGTATPEDEDATSNTSEDIALEISTGMLAGRRRWEDSLHPYIFFNEDHETVTFINVNMNRDGDLVDFDGKVLKKQIADWLLVAVLVENGVKLGKKFDTFTRDEKLDELCRVVGVGMVFDPDETYELTADCVQKLIAIHMRFRCQIPVIIMGETGCGKTRMVEFLSKLLAKKAQESIDSQEQVKNLIVRKIYGGITTTDIFRTVWEAEEIAKKNHEEHGICTILFFDEANTTEAIHAIKEVICDHTVDGKPIKDVPLHIIAACNPYRKLSENAIKRLENSGLGSKIHASTAEQMEGNEMRSLLYRVNPLPPSLNPFVWNFGQLDFQTEMLYIEKIANKHITEMDHEKFCFVVARAQKFMREQEDECRFVSLRDVERCVMVFQWFMKHHKSISCMLKGQKLPSLKTDEWAILQTLGVCYHASLEDRLGFRKDICRSFREGNIHQTLTEVDVLEEFKSVESIFLKGIKLGDGICCNEALLENFFMMAICIDLKIPLFLIGKPGSSKSLAKKLISNNMQGRYSRTDLFQNMKQVRLVPYQCSALSAADEIKGIFAKCVRLQEDANEDSYTAVAVLDEIGLAEDSPKMPLKILHPLLESGTLKTETITSSDRRCRVGFIGISNWPLDPAKLNRGIFVLRAEPNKEDLLHIGQAICQGAGDIPGNDVQRAPLVALTDAYLEIYRNQRVEYFGLRDYYNLIKMVCKGSWGLTDIFTAVVRNFGGGKNLEECNVLQTFQSKLRVHYPAFCEQSIPLKTIVGKNLEETDSRFLLLLTGHHPSTSLVSILVDDCETKCEVVFGSSFPGDHNYTEICRNLNLIKVRMERGDVVILLNMTEIHESLYDALNQHSVMLGGKRYVDLGFGEHRVKCCISPQFRLIIIEQKLIAHNEYPIPLLNRLEKHHLTASSLLQEHDHERIATLNTWVESLNTEGFSHHEAFVGYHDDTVPSVVMFQNGEIAMCKDVLMQSMTMDAVIRYLAEKGSQGPDEGGNGMYDAYFEKQCHGSVIDLLSRTIAEEKLKPVTSFEIVTYCHVLSMKDKLEYQKRLGLSENSMMIMNLEQFYTRKECEDKLDSFLKRCTSESGGGASPCVAILLVQCMQGQRHGALIECFKHIWSNKMRAVDVSSLKRSVIAIILWSVERAENSELHCSYHQTGNLILQQSKTYDIIYVDELAHDDCGMPVAKLLRGRISDLFSPKGEDDKRHIMHIIQDCICDAVRKVKTPWSGWYIQCLNAMTHLCSSQEDLSRKFQDILLEKLRDGHATLERSTASASSHFCSDHWIAKESYNREKLQEGGTFRKTLMLRIKDLTSQLLAHLISLMAVNQNLDIISEVGEEDWKCEMWLTMFKDLGVKWEKNTLGKFHVATKRGLDQLCANKFPFSSAITDLFEDLWKKMEHDDSKMWKLIESFRKSQFFSSIKTEIGRENLAEIMTAYNHDLITALYTPANVGEEFEAVKKIVLDLSEYEWQKMAANSSDGDQIPLIFYMFQKLSKTLEILSSLFLAQPQLFSNVDDWIEKQKASETDIIHHCALSDAIEVLHCDARKKDHETCLEWLRSFSQINLIFHPLLDLFGESEKKAILKKWMPLSLLELMLLQLLPVETELKLQYSEIIWVQSILLLKGSESLDLQSEDFLAVVCNVLKKCYEDIRLKFGLSWQSTKCKVCKRQMREPMLLDCGHFLCQKCFKAFQSREPPICPFCRNEVSKSPVSWGLSSDEMEQVAKFKSRCTEVFVEFLRNIGFSTHFPGSSKVKFRRLSKILLCVIGGTKTDMKQTLRTEAINLDLSTAANILSLVMDNDPENARQQINTMLETLDQSNTVQLAGVILGYFERKMYYDRYGEDVQQQEGILGYDNLLNDAWNTIEALKGSKPNLRMLQSIAHVRYCLRKIIGYLCSNRGESTTNPSLQMFCSSVSTIFGNDGIKSNVLRKFLFKAGCDFVGIKWYYMLQSQGLQDLLPYELHNRKLDICGDYLSLMGEKYITTKCSLLSCQHDVADLVRSICSGLTGDGSHQKIMALIEWARIISTDSLEISDVLCHPQILPLAKLYERISSLGVVTASLHSSKNVLPSLAILMNMILSEKCTLMEVFRKLVDHPNDISSFNPSSMFKKDTGHVCTDWAASVIQGMLNICLLIGLSKNRDAVARLLQYEKQHIESILVEGIETSLEKQMSLLQRSKDEIIMTMHLVLIEMLRIKKIDELAEEHFDWITVEGMTSWQKLFCKHYLEPMYDDLDMKLSSAKERLEEDMVATKNPLFMLLKDIPSDVSPIENLSWKHSALWMYTKELTLDDFRRSLENHEERTGHAGVVNVILNTRNLDFGKYLESILKFQQIMTARCQNHKFEKLCEAIESEQENEKAEEYLRIWNKVCVEADFKVMAKDTGIPISYLHEASINSPVSICLPSICGQGRCAKLLVSYLIDIQNSFLDNCAEIGKYPMRTTKMDVSRLSHSQFVSIDVKRDLLPLIFTYTKYDIVTSRAGRQHNITYNFETLEKQVEGRFVSYKQRIDKKTIPCFRAPYDMQTESEWKEVQSKAPQKQLPMSMVRQIAATAWHSTKIYSAVRAIAQAITFIAKGDVEPKTSLVKFLVTELALPAAEVQAIPSAANIEHILPLYSHLSWHRTIVYMSRGLNPYRDAVCYTPLENVKDKKLIEEIQHGFEHVEIATLQRHLNELIIRVPDFPPDSSLVDDVLPHYEFESEGGKEDWVSRIPREVCLKHSSHLISLSLEFQQSMETS